MKHRSFLSVVIVLATFRRNSNFNLLISYPSLFIFFEISIFAVAYPRQDTQTVVINPSSSFSSKWRELMMTNSCGYCSLISYRNHLEFSFFHSPLLLWGTSSGVGCPEFHRNTCQRSLYRSWQLTPSETKGQDRHSDSYKPSQLPTCMRVCLIVWRSCANRACTLSTLQTSDSWWSPPSHFLDCDRFGTASSHKAWISSTIPKWLAFWEWVPQAEKLFVFAIGQQ